ncbi:MULTISPECIES: inositol-1-monophosphatase [Psychromonas]|uniref:inositol-1-monophosphatase n=1 Tax=Psychromonas TaxID=67572 RepID=UPI0004170731|nr:MULTISPECIES: inositol-1-monophosphatase [Psychromonas]MBB1272651.1 inositol-1-monophosphatase [Psychromonas sp. SR45-3]
MHPMLNIAIRAARNAGKVIVKGYENLESVEVEEKSLNDYVSSVDKEAELAIIGTLRKSYPDHSIIAEESGIDNGADTDHQWIIDPLDGTSNFIHGIPHFAVSIALKIKGRTEVGVVFDPIRNELFSAVRGQSAQINGYRTRTSTVPKLAGTLLATGFPFKQKYNLETYLNIFQDFFKDVADMRRGGSAALDLAYVAAGRMDGFWEFGLKPWDIAAGELLLKESGAMMTDFNGGNDYFKSGDVVAANPKLLKEMLTVIRKHNA